MHGNIRNTYKFLVGKPEGKRGIDGRPILNWTLGKWVGGCRMD
jgi:hypothetical protein